jgi:hypothetical protein
MGSFFVIMTGCDRIALEVKREVGVTRVGSCRLF